MGAKRRRIEAGVKARVALAAVGGDRTTSQLVSAFGVHATQVGQWKRRLVEGAADLFSDDRRREVQQQDAGENCRRSKMSSRTPAPPSPRGTDDGTPSELV